MNTRQRVGVLALAWVVACGLAFTAPGFAEERLTLRDGRVIVLADNGTWAMVQDKAAKAADYRGVVWGSGPGLAKTAEGKDPDYEEDGVLAFQTKVAGLACLVAYFYVEDRLVRGRYVFQTKHDNDNDFIDDYNKVKSILESKYGKSTNSRQVWKSETSFWKDQPNTWGSRVRSGDATFVTSWETPASGISLTLSGSDYQVIHAVDYWSKELQYLESSRQADEF